MAPRHSVRAGVTVAAAVVLAPCACASYPVDIRVHDLLAVIRGTASPPGTAGAYDSVPAPGSAPPTLDFTYNDTVVWVAVDPASARSSAASLSDALFDVQHATHGVPNRGPLLGVNVSVERCQLSGAGAAWVSAGSNAAGAHIAADGGAARAEYLTLDGPYEGRMRIPLHALWGWLSLCQAPSCTYTLTHGPPAAVGAALGSSAAADAAAAVLGRLPPSLLPAGGFASTGFALGRDAAVVVGDVGAEAGAAAARAAGLQVKGSVSTAQAAAQAHADALPSLLEPTKPEAAVLAYRWLLERATGREARAAAAAAAAPPPPLACNPGSVRVTAVEWALPAAPFQVLARLALDDDEALQAYTSAAARAERNWEAELEEARRQCAKFLRQGGYQLPAVPLPFPCNQPWTVPEVFAALWSAVRRALHYVFLGQQQPEPVTWQPGALSPRRRAEAQRNVLSLASWLGLPNEAKRGYTATEAAALRLNDTEGAPADAEALAGEVEATLARLAGKTSFTLAHWWPGYQLDLGVGPAVTSYVVAPRPPRHALSRVFGEAWVVALFMLSVGSLILAQNVARCALERRRTKRLHAAAAAYAATKKRRAGSDGQLDEAAAPAAAAGGSPGRMKVETLASPPPGSLNHGQDSPFPASSADSTPNAAWAGSPRLGLRQRR